MESLGRKLDEWRKRGRSIQSALTKHRKEQKADKDQRRQYVEKRAELRNDLAAAKARDKDRVRIEPLERRISDLTAKIEALDKRIKERKKRIAEVIKRKRHIQKRIRFYVVKKTTARKKWKQAKKDHAEGRPAKYEPYMLNGCPDTLSDDMKAVLAFVVVGFDQVCTATSNGGHSVGSYHFYSPCRAIDFAGVYYKMQEAQRAIRAKFGDGFRELFGPDGWYLKNGVYVAAQFPNHQDHGHAARNF